MGFFFQFFTPGPGFQSKTILKIEMGFHPTKNMDFEGFHWGHFI